MNEKLSVEQRFLLSIIKQALVGKPEVQPSNEHKLTKPQWVQVFGYANKHAILPLLYDVLEQEAAMPRYLFQQVQSISRQTVMRSYRLLYLTNYIVQLLQREAVAVVVLKGAATANLYPTPELRKSGDVDLLVPKAQDFAKTRTVLEQHGFQCKEQQASNHHVVFQGKDGIEIEIHTTLAEPFDNQSINQYLERLSVTFCAHTQEQEILGSLLPVPTDAYHAFYLLLHMLQHFLRAGFGIKLLCDWVVFWNRAVASAEVQHFLQLVEDTGLDGFLEQVTAVCVRYLGLDVARVPFFSANAVAEASVEELMLEILEAEEFGKSGKERMVMMRGTHIRDYVREFHHQMCLNYPRARKIYGLWPALWAGTLFRFLYNNRVVRNTSAAAILRKATARSRNLERMQLFQVGRRK